MRDPRNGQADEDFARNRIRGIRHIVEQYYEQGSLSPVGDTLAQIKAECEAVLSRPRSNGLVIDRLERKVGDLQSRVIDIDIYKLERDAALKRARAAEAELRAFTEGAGRLETLGRRIDRFVAKIVR